MEMYRVVLVKHPNVEKQFMFKVPEKKFLDPGDRVLCNTSRGNCQMATCISPAFDILECQLKELWGVKPETLKPIVGILHPVMWVYEGDPHAED